MNRLTHVTRSIATAFDNMLLDQYKFPITNSVPYSEKTNHLPVFQIIGFKGADSNYSANFNQFKELEKKIVENTLSLEDPNGAYNTNILRFKTYMIKVSQFVIPKQNLIIKWMPDHWRAAKIDEAQDEVV